MTVGRFAHPQARHLLAQVAVLAQQPVALLQQARHGRDRRLLCGVGRRRLGMQARVLQVQDTSRSASSHCTSFAQNWTNGWGVCCAKRSCRREYNDMAVDAECTRCSLRKRHQLQDFVPELPRRIAQHNCQSGRLDYHRTGDVLYKWVSEGTPPGGASPPRRPSAGAPAAQSCG